MVSPFFKSSDRVRDFAKYVIIYSLAALFLNFFDITLEKIPFTDLPLPKSGRILSVSAVLSLLALYTWFQLLIQYRTEYLDYERADLEFIVEDIRKGTFGEALPPAVKDKVASQEAFASLQDALVRTHKKIQLTGWIRIVNELVVPTGILALALFVDAGNIALFFKTLRGLGALTFFAVAAVALIAVIAGLYVIERTALSDRAKWFWRLVVVLAAAIALVLLRACGVW